MKILLPHHTGFGFNFAVTLPFRVDFPNYGVSLVGGRNDMTKRYLQFRYVYFKGNDRRESDLRAFPPRTVPFVKPLAKQHELSFNFGSRFVFEPEL
jgi:hypothetical protein